ncbi:TPA: hypothetical protein ACIVI6_003964, partial [Salmonella enterica subsp. diarizonae serovar 50:k:z35]
LIIYIDVNTPLPKESGIVWEQYALHFDGTHLVSIMSALSASSKGSSHMDSSYYHKLAFSSS